MKKFLFFILFAIVSLNCFLPFQVTAAELSTGSGIYVPIYRSFYQIYGSSRDSYNLTSTACFHNRQIQSRPSRFLASIIMTRRGSW